MPVVLGGGMVRRVLITLVYLKQDKFHPIAYNNNRIRRYVSYVPDCSG
jgi:hypothetical protein